MVIKLNRIESNELFKSKFTEFMNRIWGARCTERVEDCQCCEAWDIYDSMISKLDNPDETYKYKLRYLEPYDIKEIENESKKGWNVCAASQNPKTLSPANMAIYFRKKL